jgi:hypothetical protein
VKKKILLRKGAASLLPADDAAVEALKRFKLHELIEVPLPSRPRNVRHHRKFFALLQLVFENQEAYPTVDALLFALKVALGHADLIADMQTGELHPSPKSISFASMDQAEFDAFYNSAVDLFVTKIIPGMNRADLEREVMEFVEDRAA